MVKQIRPRIIVTLGKLIFLVLSILMLNCKDGDVEQKIGRKR